MRVWYIILGLVGQLLMAGELPSSYEYVFPLPNSQFISPSTTVILRFGSINPKSLINLSQTINAVGEQSGKHNGTTILAADKRTLIFKSDTEYLPGETVNISIIPILEDTHVTDIEPLLYKFTVLSNEALQFTETAPEKSATLLYDVTREGAEAQITQNGVSVPADFPHVNITQSNNPSSDYIFLNNWGPPNYNIIFDTSGAPVWYWKTPDRRRDFKLQDNGWLTMLVRDGYGGSGDGYIALDKNYEYIKSFRTTNGYSTDEHELQVLPDSSYFLIGRRESVVDMSQYVTGGQSFATVRETCIQEFTADDQLIFIWRAWDHFDIRDLELESLTSNYIRFPHMNAIDIDTDGNILLSSRHLSEISKINRQSGDFIWRLCGVPESPNNEFIFENDPLSGFRNQHSIRALGNNHYTIFDNGNLHSPAVSRAVEYAIDTVLNKATLVWEFQNDQSNAQSYYMGNTQRLANGNTHINWAVGNTMPIASEITPNGEKAFEMWFTGGDHSYRTFRFPWNGMRLTPYLLLESQFDNLTLIFNKFGDDNVEYYKIYGDTRSQATTLLDTSVQTMKKLSNLENGKRYYFRVTAVDTNGIESDFSNEENVLVKMVQPGTNMLVNGDFSDGFSGWIWQVAGSASADWQIENGVSHIGIQNGGDQIWEVQLRQTNIQLIQGQEYTLEYDAWATDTRYAEIKVGQDSDPYINYSRIGYIPLSSLSHHYSYTFTMQDPSDNNARFVINAGLLSQDVFIDNISLVMTVPTGLDDHFSEITEFELYPNYPNPYNQASQIQYYLPEASRVELTIYNINGQVVGKYNNGQQVGGKHTHRIEVGNLSSGIYFYSLEAHAVNSNKNFSQTNKMILLK
jgi:hypothetical protein